MHICCINHACCLLNACLLLTCFLTSQDLRRVAIEELKKVESNLDKESSEDAELRDKYGSRWNRPASAALNSSMREKIAGYNANLTAAGDSDARLEQRLMQNNAAFSALSIDAAVAQMPRLQVCWNPPWEAVPVLSVHAPLSRGQAGAPLRWKEKHQALDRLAASRKHETSDAMFA